VDRGRHCKARTPRPWSHPARPLRAGGGASGGDGAGGGESSRGELQACNGPSLPAGGASTTSPASDC
jgi:hypothetical protein